MAVYDNAYSRFVAIARVVLPIAAIMLLSTLFLFSHRIDPDKAIPFAEVDVEQILRDEQVSVPNYSAVMASGTAISVTADSVLPDAGSADDASAKDITARLDFTSGTRALVRAPDGQLNSGQSNLNLTGGVVIMTTDGLRIETEALTSQLDRTDITATGTVTANSPFGTLSAGQMHLTDTGGENSSYVAVFNKGVKLVYRPGAAGDDR